MAIEIKQQLRLTQQLVMTPQLQQAIKLLQLSRLELVNLVQQELQENPVLEEGLETEEVPSAEVEREVELPEAPQPEAPEVPSEREASDAEKIADVDWQNYIESNPQTSYSEARDDDERRPVESAATQPSLARRSPRVAAPALRPSPTRSVSAPAGSSETSTTTAICATASRTSPSSPALPIEALEAGLREDPGLRSSRRRRPGPARMPAAPARQPRHRRSARAKDHRGIPCRCSRSAISGESRGCSACRSRRWRQPRA